MTVTNGEPQFEPEAISAKAGTITFYLTNVPGVILEPDHNMLIGPTLYEEMARTPYIRARETVSFTVEGLPAGTYVYWCSVKAIDGSTDHAAGGMVGTLTVTP